MLTESDRNSLRATSMNERFCYKDHSALPHVPNTTDFTTDIKLVVPTKSSWFALRNYLFSLS